MEDCPAELAPRVEAAKALRMWTYRIEGYESHRIYEHAVKILGQEDVDWFVESFKTPRKVDTVWTGSKDIERSYSMALPLQS